MAAQVEIDDQASVTDLDDGEIIDPISDDEADSLSIVLLDEGNPERDVITTCFLSGMSTTAAAVANETTIVAVSKNSSEGITTRAKFLAFRVFTEAMARKNGGDANVKYGWYAGSKEEIEGVISFGFSSREIRRFENQAGSHGIGIHLVPSKFSVIAAADTEPDEEGLRYLLLCRIILGKPELIVSGSKQSYPSSNEFDSGVDNLQNPRKYVIWSSTMNSYILPSYIVSFRSPNLRGTRPRSPWVSFASLMSILAKSIDPSRMNLIISTCNDFRKGKIRREELVRKMREVAGDNLLAHIIKNHGDKNKANV